MEKMDCRAEVDGGSEDSSMNAAEVDALLRKAREGDRAAVGALLEGQRSRLRRMVALRLDRRLRGRIDATDVIQEAFLEASQRFDDYLKQPAMPFYLWLRFITNQRLQLLYREHVQAQRRDVRREVSLTAGGAPEASSEAIAAQLLGTFTTPSQVAIRAELKARLRETLESMDPADRESIALRHFEHLSNAEVAQVLGLDESAASKRYIRAIKRLRALLSGISGMQELPWR